MRREDIKAIFAEATDEQLQKIMSLHGADVEKYKSKVTALETQAAENKTAFDKLNTEFEQLKASKASAEDFKTKFEQLQADIAEKEKNDINPQQFSLLQEVPKEFILFVPKLNSKFYNINFAGIL